jgi:hypothetical protein
VTGTVLRERTLSTAGGRQVRIRVLRPDYSLDNVHQLVSTYHLWRQQAASVDTQHPEAGMHAAFAAEVAWIAARELGRFSTQPRHLLVVAVDDEDQVLGINTAYWVPEEQAWYMAVGTTRPLDQPGYPNPDQVRGIGLEVVGALVKLMNAEVCAPVTLEPLDAASQRFWAARGFHEQARGFPDRRPEEMVMTCPESRVLEEKLQASERDDPARGDAPFFAERRRLSRYSAVR